MADGMTISETHTTISLLDGTRVVLLERAGHTCGCCGMWVHAHACHVEGQPPPADLVVRLRTSAVAYATDPGAERLAGLLRQAADFIEERIA